MTSDEAYEHHKAELVEVAFANSFVALKVAFQAGWEAKEKLVNNKNQHGGIT